MPNVTGQAMGVLGHHLHGVRAVGLVDPQSARGSDAVRMQEHHDFAHDPLLGPGVDDPPGAHRADPVDLPQAAWLRLDHIEHLSPKARTSFLA